MKLIIKIYLIFSVIAMVILLLMDRDTKAVVYQKQNNDSVLVSEYQMALDTFMKVNPKGAEQFMELIEKVNTGDR